MADSVKITDLDLFRLVGECLHIGAWQYDVADNSLSWNDEVCKMHGLPGGCKPDVVEAINFYVEQDRDMVQTLFQRCVDVAEPFEFKATLAPADGELKTVVCRGYAICDQNGKPARVMGTIQDVSHDEWIEQQLHDQREINDTVFEAITEGILLVNRQGRVVKANPAMEELLGYAPDEMNGLPVSSLVHKIHRDRYEQWHEQFVAAPKQVATGIPFKRLCVDRHGREFQAELVISAMVIDGDNYYAVIIRDITEQEELSRKIENLAYRDIQTGFRNRQFLQENFPQLVGAGQYYLALIDLKNFREYNQGLGHEYGDHVLRITADRITAQVTERQCFRVGADQFLLLVDQDKVHDMDELLKLLLNELQQNIVVAPYTLAINCNIGVARYPQDADNFSEVFKQVMMANSVAKQDPHRQIAYFQPQMMEESLTFIELSNELRDALLNNQVVAWFQPIIRLQEHELVAFEALARWQHPQRGFIPPDQFIAVAEKAGLIIELGDHMLRQACTFLRHCLEQGYPLDHVSVNVSTAQLLDTHFSGKVVAMLREFSLEPSSLMLEITEGFLDVGDLALQKLLSLQQQGVRLSIDDFGTGYSSLSRLRDFPIDELKIDREFIRRMDNSARDRQLVKMILDLAENLNITVVAEGLEEQHQVEQLLAWGCSAAQGYYFGRPQDCQQSIQLLQQLRAGHQISA